MNSQRRQQFLLLMTGLVVGIYFADRLLITPALASWKDRSLRIVELEKSLTQGELLLQRDRAIRSRWEEIRARTLPRSPSEAENEILKAFERWSQVSELSISSIQPQWREGDEEYLSLECRAEGFGDMAAVARFLFEAERDELPIKVDGVEISARDPQGSVLTLALQVSGLVLRADKEETR